tara:strand:+ start:13613 stop:13855 length:243 start_codon:yes stop_codon:yes gene_type:complete
MCDCLKRDCLECYENSLADSFYSKYIIDEEPWKISKNSDGECDIMCMKCKKVVLKKKVKELTTRRIYCDYCFIQTDTFTL